MRLTVALHGFLWYLDEKIYPDPQKTGEKPWGVYLRDCGYTAWDIVLCCARKTLGGDWNDIEGCVSKWIKRPKNKHNLHISRVWATLRGNAQNTPGQYSVPEDWRDYCGARLTEYPEVEVARYIMDVHPDDSIDTWSHSEILTFLLEDLHRLESRFICYLNDALDSTPGYADEAMCLLKRIRSDRFCSGNSRQQTTVLNFNYTTPYEYGSVSINNIAEVLNIHGRLDDEVVFGIDGSDCMSDSEALLFTKTYRIMAMGMDDVIDIVFPPTSIYGMETRMIKFFGHSLSKPDYAYFQALFDTVDLYAGRTTLVFYYRPFGEGSESVRDVRCRKKVMSDVIKLLVAYGATLDNKDHGKNLIHKLLLEGRLHVARV